MVFPGVDPTNSHTYEEIMRQPQTWEQTWNVVLAQRSKLEERFADANPEEVLFTGSGTSYYISIAAASTFQEITGMSARAVPASEIFLKPDSVINATKRTIIIGVSRSGTTSEVIRAFHFAQAQRQIPCISVSGYPESELVKNSDYSIVLPHIQEKSVVMTSSFTNILYSLQLLAGIVAGNQAYLEELSRIPRDGAFLLPRAKSLAEKLGSDLDFRHFIYLGLGAYFGLANEGMLKMKEMTQTFAEAFNSLEFRHGPISVVDSSCLVVLLSDSSIKKYEADVAQDVRKFGAFVVVVGENLADFESDVKFETNSTFSDVSRAILYMPFLQLLAFYRTKALGLNPDQPRNLSHVVKLAE